MIRAVFVATIALAALGACSSSAPPPPPQPMLTQDQLEDPTVCKECHETQYDAWASSMHAYAGQDPIFIAMNARGQRDTNGALGSFCVQCHAPLAVRAGLTTDGQNLATLPAWSKGVTCFFCHTADAAPGANDDPLVLAGDGVMRATIADLAPGAPHTGGYSILHDGHQSASSQLCGTCHDVTNQHGVSIERTFAEWTTSEFSHQLTVPDNTKACPSCHMASSQGQAASYPTTSPTREIHDHAMAGVDVALIPFPGTDAQRTLVTQQLAAAVDVQLCVSNDTANVTLESENVGHAWPSGAIQDRRAWVELVAKSSGQVVFQSGVVPDGQSVLSINDPNLWVFREPMFDDSGSEVSFLWQATSVGTTSGLPVATALAGPGAAHSVAKAFTLPSGVDEVTARVRIVPLDPAQLADLVSTGDLDPSVPAAMTTFAAGTTATWSAGGASCVP